MFWFKKRSKLRGFRKREIKIINKPVYENPYFQRKKPSFILRLLKKPKFLIQIFIILGLVYLFFYAQFFKIEKVEIQGNQELTYDSLRYEVNKAFVKRRFIIFRQSNIFIYHNEAAEKNLWDTFALDEIKINKRFPDKIMVKIKEKIPNLTLISQGKYYYLDLKGVVTHEISKEEVKLSFPKIEDSNNRKVKLKDSIISENIIQAIFTLKDDFNSKTNTKIDKFIIPIINCPSTIDKELKKEPIPTNTNINKSSIIFSNSNQNPDLSKNINLNNNFNTSQTINNESCNLVPITKDITVKTEEGWEAYFTIIEDIPTQLERLKVYLLKKALDKESRKNLIYIDLRFGDKIYVKEK